MAAGIISLKEFIDAYRNQRSLWDTTAPEYQIREKKRIGYSKLLSILLKSTKDSTLYDVKRKINILRSNYRKELKKVKMSEATAGDSKNIYQPSIWWFDSMNFLRKLEQSVDPIIPTVDDKPKKKDNVLSNMEEENISKADDNSTPVPAKRAKLTDQQKMISLACEYLEKGNDNYDYMAKIWANKLKTLERNQSLLAERAINEIIFQAQIGTLTMHTVTPAFTIIPVNSALNRHKS